LRSVPLSTELEDRPAASRNQVKNYPATREILPVKESLSSLTRNLRAPQVSAFKVETILKAQRAAQKIPQNAIIFSDENFHILL